MKRRRVDPGAGRLAHSDFNVGFLLEKRLDDMQLLLLSHSGCPVIHHARTHIQDILLLQHLNVNSSISYSLFSFRQQCQDCLPSEALSRTPGEWDSIHNFTSDIWLKVSNWDKRPCYCIYRNLLEWASLEGITTHIDIVPLRGKLSNF